MNSIIALFSVLLLLLPLAMGWKWYLLLGNFQNCFAFSSSSAGERGRENISESDPSLFLSSGLSIMWEGGEEEEAAKVHQIQPQVP